jgi:hypothetical protein
MVNRAGRTGSSSINFVISHYFVDQNKDFIVDNYCFKLSGARAWAFSDWGSLNGPSRRGRRDAGAAGGPPRRAADAPRRRAAPAAPQARPNARR